MWAELEMDAANKGRKLWEANEQQQFYRAVKDVDLWLDEVEKQLASEDLGKVSYNKKKSLLTSSSYSSITVAKLYYIPSSSIGDTHNNYYVCAFLTEYEL